MRFAVYPDDLGFDLTCGWSTDLYLAFICIARRRMCPGRGGACRARAWGRRSRAERRTSGPRGASVSGVVERSRECRWCSRVLVGSVNGPLDRSKQTIRVSGASRRVGPITPSKSASQVRVQGDAARRAPRRRVLPGPRGRGHGPRAGHAHGPRGPRGGLCSGVMRIDNSQTSARLG